LIVIRVAIVALLSLIHVLRMGPCVREKFQMFQIQH
jgi:hypothetical protein